MLPRSAGLAWTAAPTHLDVWGQHPASPCLPEVGQEQLLQQQLQLHAAWLLSEAWVLLSQRCDHLLQPGWLSSEPKLGVTGLLQLLAQQGSWLPSSRGSHVGGVLWLHNSY